MSQRSRLTVLPVQSSSVLVDPALRITFLNENWRGKSDPEQRRRIQNRLNQRAFREKQRSGRVAKHIERRSNHTTPKFVGEERVSEGTGRDGDRVFSSGDKFVSDCDNVEELPGRGSRSLPPFGTLHDRLDSQVSRSAYTTPTYPIYGPWDELSHLINHNFMNAVTENAQRLRLSLVSLRSGTIASTTRYGNAVSLPHTLDPVELQHQLPHDPIIDTLPHARLRYNILRAIMAGEIDAGYFSMCLRRSGTVVDVQGEALRSGLIVWDVSEQLSSWELSEAFAKIWGFLLPGCEDFIAATNVWRHRKGEGDLVLDFGANGR